MTKKWTQNEMSWELRGLVLLMSCIAFALCRLTVSAHDKDSRCPLNQAWIWVSRDSPTCPARLSAWAFNHLFLIYTLCVCVCVCVSGPQLQHTEVLRLGVRSELRLLATWDLSCVCDLHHGSRQRPILNPLDP